MGRGRRVRERPVTAEGLKPAYKTVGGQVFWDRTANGYRLPTEAEWEYAAWAVPADVPLEDPFASTRLCPVATAERCPAATVGVAGTGDPNRFGLSDTLGNAREWVFDAWAPYWGDATDPAGPKTGTTRVIRGRVSSASSVRALVTDRAHDAADLRERDLGFRLARDL